MRLAQKTTSVRMKIAIQTILARMSQCPCKRVSPLLCLSVLTLASIGADGRFILVPLFKPISQMVKHKEDYDDLVYRLLGIFQHAVMIADMKGESYRAG